MDELVERLRVGIPSLLVNRPVSLAYLFGSAATGRTHSQSDVDIALLTDELTPYEQLRLILALQRELADECAVPNGDVRIVNEAPLVFQGRVVTDGILLYARSKAERVEYETTTRMRYFDYLPIHRQIQDAFFARVKEKGLNG